jgi:quercetin dioxygenase-like cupin family protein
MSTAPSPKLVAPGEGKRLALYAVKFGYKVESADSGGSLAVMEVEIPAKTLVKPHNHTREDEFSVVLQGPVGVRIADRVLEADTGSYLVKPRGTPHAMWNAGDTPVKVIEMVSPAGLETYFEELGTVLTEHRGDAPRYYELAQRYGITIMDEWIEELETAYGIKL